MLDNLHQTPLFQWSGWIFGFLGFVLAIVFYLLSRKEKKPWWTIHSTNMIKGFAKKVQNLEIKFAGKEVENLTVSKIYFWNAGRETINTADISEADPLRIVARNDAQILDVKVLKENKPASRFLVSTNAERNQYYLSFDFLDKDWGAVIQVIHTGVKSADVGVVGSIRGSSGPTKKARNHQTRWSIARQFKALFAFCVFAIAFLPLVAYLTGKPVKDALHVLLMASVGTLPVAIGIFWPGVPKDLLEED
jgi:hypothetical protein